MAMPAELVDWREREVQRLANISRQTLAPHRETKLPVVTKVSELLDEFVPCTPPAAGGEDRGGAQLPDRRRSNDLPQRIAPGLHQPDHQRDRCHRAEGQADALD